jgi:hypothetical protein
MQRPEQLAACHSSIGRFGMGTGSFGHQRHDRIDMRVGCGDVGEVSIE